MAAPTRPSPVPALKEWAVIVSALLEGEQIVDVRKGGIREEGRHFGLQSTRLWLYPTYLHQDPGLLKPAYRAGVERTVAEAPPAEVVRIPGWADVVGVATLTEPDQLAAIDSKFIWTLEYAASRLKWKRRDPLWVLVLRTFVLDQPIDVPYRDEYGGCTSWVDVADLPADPAALASTPSLSDDAFEARLKFLENDLAVPVERPSTQPAAAVPRARQ